MNPSIIVVMGASGSGKSTVGRCLASSLQWDFHDADSYHSPENIARMRNGISLSDDDRRPWLSALQTLMSDILNRGNKAVLACSALRQSYRAALTPTDAKPNRIQFVYLDVAPEVLAMRLVQRKEHFMSATLLESQLATLEKPAAGQEAYWLNGEEHPLVIVEQIREHFKL